MSGPNTDYDPVEVTVLQPEQVEQATAAALAAIAAAADLEELKRVRIEHAGDRSPLALANREIGALPPQARKEAGQRVGRARGTVQQALAARQAELEAEARGADARRGDGRRHPAHRPGPAGARHPLTTGSELIADIFVAMGWEVAEGPLVEAEWLNFDALNLGPDHPARTMQDTFWVEPPEDHLVLRTHTSPVQARTMLERTPPIYVVCPGRVFRTDEFDATHSPVFHQVEGLAIDEGITMAHLKGTLDHFAPSMFGEGIVTRFRPSYFPFTEPSAEVDLVCFVCRDVDAALLPHLPRRGLDRVGRLRRREPAGAARLRRRRRPLHRLRVRHGHRPHADVPPRHRGPARRLRGRRPLHHRFRERAVMKAPVSWIREHVDLPDDVTTEQLAARLTALGLKLEAIQRPADAITGPLVVGKVLSVEPEPQKNGKTINWYQVDVGDANGTGEPQGIVCGAHNFDAGDLVVVVLPGGVLPGNFEISARKTYGHVSAGMICSARELGLGDDHDGIIVLPAGAGAPGDDAFGVLGLDDDVIEFEINPDRAYALSIRGVARDAALGLRRGVHRPGRPRGARGRRRRPPGGARRHRRLPAVRRPHRLRLRPRRAHARLDGAPAGAGRHAPDLARRRRHQLRDARDRPPDPRLRRRQAHRHRPGPPRARGGAAHHPRRHRPGASTRRTSWSSTTPASSGSAA